MARTTKISAAQAKQSVGATDWTHLKMLSDAEVEAAAAKDVDAQPFTPQELRQFKRASVKSSGKK